MLQTKWILFALIFLVSNILVAQDTTQKALIKKLGISKSAHYAFLFKNGIMSKDSNIILSNKYNKEGLVYEEVNYQYETTDENGRVKSGDVVATSRFEYLNDSILINKKLLLEDNLTPYSTMKLSYNSRGLKKKELITLFNNSKITTKYKYNKANRLVLESTNRFNTNRSNIQYFYNTKGELKEILSNSLYYPSKTLYYNDSSKHIYSMKLDGSEDQFMLEKYEYNKENRVIKESIYYEKEKSIVLLGEVVTAKPKDELTTETSYLPNGLIEYKKYWFNNIYQGIEKIKYVKK